MNAVTYSAKVFPAGFLPRIFNIADFYVTAETKSEAGADDINRPRENSVLAEVRPLRSVGAPTLAGPADNGEKAPRLPTCSVHDCGNRVFVTALCSTHRRRLRERGTTALTTTRRLPLDERFAARIEPDGHGCWVWRESATYTYDAYPKFYIGGDSKEVRAHRWAYERFVGPIPEGHQIDHICGMTLCVRPGHLQTLTPEEHRLITADRKRFLKDAGLTRMFPINFTRTTAEYEFGRIHRLPVAPPQAMAPHAYAA